VTAAKHMQESAAIVGDGLTLVRKPSGCLLVVTRSGTLELSARQAQQLIAALARLWPEAA
jgi:hypothetical protein